MWFFLKRRSNIFLRLSYLVAVKLRLPQNPRNLIKPARYLKKKHKNCFHYMYIKYRYINQINMKTYIQFLIYLSLCSLKKKKQKKPNPKQNTNTNNTKKKISQNPPNPSPTPNSMPDGKITTRSSSWRTRKESNPTARQWRHSLPVHSIAVRSTVRSR